MEYWMGTAASVRLEVGRADHVAPHFSLVGNEFSEFGRCHQHWVNAEAGKPVEQNEVHRPGRSSGGSAGAPLAARSLR